MTLLNFWFILNQTALSGESLYHTIFIHHTYGAHKKPSARIKQHWILVSQIWWSSINDDKTYSIGAHDKWIQSQKKRVYLGVLNDHRKWIVHFDDFYRIFTPIPLNCFSRLKLAQIDAAHQFISLFSTINEILCIFISSSYSQLAFDSEAHMLHRILRVKWMEVTILSQTYVLFVWEKPEFAQNHHFIRCSHTPLFSFCTIANRVFFSAFFFSIPIRSFTGCYLLSLLLIASIWVTFASPLLQSSRQV